MRSPSLSSSSSAARGAGVGKKEAACCNKVGLKRGPWTAEEDEMLADYIRREGEGRWRTLPKKAGLLRCGKSCRLRWMNYLRPSVKRGHITPDEEDLILRLHRLLGNRWSLIAGRIPGRTDNEIKNYWNTHLSKKLISQGIDPKTHRPLVNDVPNHDRSDVVNNKQKHHDVMMLNKHGDTANVVDDHDHLDDLEKDTLRVHVEDGDIVDDMAITCSDDAFASFLNSLINEDMFNNNNNNNNNPQQNEEEQEDDQTSSCLI